MAAEAWGGILQIAPHPRRGGRYLSDVKPPKMPAFTGLPRQSVVECTMAWIGRYSRLSQDYKCHPESPEALIYSEMSRLMLRRLARQAHTACSAPNGRASHGLHELSKQPLVL